MKIPMWEAIVAVFGFLLLAIFFGVPVLILAALVVLLARLIWYNLKGH